MSRPLMHILIVRHLAEPDVVEAHAPEHIAYLERYHAAGTFIVSGQTVPAEAGGVIIAAGTTRDEIERITKDDPFVQVGVSEYEIITIRARRMASAVAKLLASAATVAEGGSEPV